MTWTMEKPTKAGWYWWRFFGSEDRVVFVWKGSTRWQYEYKGKDFLLSEAYGEWSSLPLEMPKERT